MDRVNNCVTPRLDMIDAFWYSVTHSSKEDFPPSADEKKTTKKKRIEDGLT